MTADSPIRQRSAHGFPKEDNQFARKCVTCKASFVGLAFGKTGERGIWRQWSWFCSAECAPIDRNAVTSTKGETS